MQTGSAAEDLEFRLEEYEKKVGKLSELLIEEELAYKSMLSERDQRISQLESLQGNSPSTRPVAPPSPSLLLMTPSPTMTYCYPTIPGPPALVSQSSFVSAAAPSPSKTKVLETRIIDMTIALEEKDRRIFELDSEIDKLKVELNQMRLEAARTVELQERIGQLESDLERADLRVPELLLRISDHEATISELSGVIDNLRVEIDTIAAERADAVVEVNIEESESLANRLTARIIELELQLAVAEQQLDDQHVQEVLVEEPAAQETPKKEEPEVRTPHMAPLEMDSLEVVMDSLDHDNEPEPDPWVSLSMAASCNSLEDIKHVGNSMVELDEEVTPDDVQYPQSPPPSAKCTGCFTNLFARRARA